MNANLPFNKSSIVADKRLIISCCIKTNNLVSKDSKDTKDSKDPKDTKDTKDSKDTKDTKDSKDTKDTKDTKDNILYYAMLLSPFHLHPFPNLPL